MLREEATSKAPLLRFFTDDKAIEKTAGGIPCWIPDAPVLQDDRLAGMILWGRSNQVGGGDDVPCDEVVAYLKAVAQWQRVSGALE